MRKLFNRIIVRNTPTSITEPISREEVVAIFGEEKVTEYERMDALGMSPQLILTQSWFDRLVSRFWMSDRDLLELGNEVVAEHAARILDELGMTTNNDGILDRITMHTDTPNHDEPRALFRHNTIQYGFFGSRGLQYEIGSGEIRVNCIAPIFYLDRKSTFREIKPARLWFFKKSIKRVILFMLAHEMRHYWQYYTGEGYKHDYVGSFCITPYEWRWVEKDANEFARKYVYKK